MQEAQKTLRVFWHSVTQCVSRCWWQCESCWPSCSWSCRFYYSITSALLPLQCTV